MSSSATSILSETLSASKASLLATQDSQLSIRKTLYIGGLALEEDGTGETSSPSLDVMVVERTLRAALIPFGPIKSIDIPRDYRKGTHKGFAFVEFEDATDAQEAIFNLDGSELFGKTLTVNISNPKHSYNNNIGSTKAIWDSDDWYRQHTNDKESGEAQRQSQNEKNEDASTLKDK